MYIIK